MSESRLGKPRTLKLRSGPEDVVVLVVVVRIDGVVAKDVVAFAVPEDRRSAALADGWTRACPGQVRDCRQLLELLRGWCMWLRWTITRLTAGSLE